jgi:putative oxidoreductase
MPPTWTSLAPYLLSLLRIVAACIFITYGTAKLFAAPGAIVPGGATVPLMSQGGAASVIEIVGGTLMLLGLFTRPVAFVLAGEMAFAYFIGHAGQGFWPVLNGGVPAVIFCFVWLYVSAAGAGPLSLDASLARKA